MYFQQSVLQNFLASGVPSIDFQPMGVGIKPALQSPVKKTFAAIAAE